MRKRCASSLHWSSPPVSIRSRIASAVSAARRPRASDKAATGAASPSDPSNRDRARIAARRTERRVSPVASGPTRSQAARSSGFLAVIARASTRSVSAANMSEAWFSSSTWKRAGTLASNGNMCSKRSHRACRVSILRPPGVSTARANRRRATFSRRRAGGLPVSSVSSAVRAASSRVTQRPRVRNTRIDMFAAAALVKVRPGCVPAARRSAGVSRRGR